VVAMGLKRQANPSPPDTRSAPELPLPLHVGRIPEFPYTTPPRSYDHAPAPRRQQNRHTGA